jgi:integrase
MRIAGDGWHGQRVRGLIVVLWRAGLRFGEALALREADLDRRRGSVLVRRGKRGRPRHQGTHARTSVDYRWCTRRAATRRRKGQRAPTLRPSPAAPRTRGREGVPLIVIQRQLGHSNLGITSVYLGSPRSIYRASTTPRSSRRSTRASPQWCRSPPRGRPCRARRAEVCGSRESQRARKRGAGARPFVGRRCAPAIAELLARDCATVTRRG